MAVVGKIVVGLTAHTAQFFREMRKVKGETGKFVRDVNMIAKSGAQMAGAFLAGAGAAVLLGKGMYDFVKPQLEAIDANGKLARRLGMSTGALLGFKHAAKLAGVDGEVLGKSLGMMVRNMGTLAATGGKDVALLKEMGVDINRLLSKSPEDAFMEIADAVAALPDPVQKAYVATRLFGSSGVDLLTVLDGGSKALRSARADLKMLGGEYSDLATIHAAAANDAIDRLKVSMNGLGTEIAISVAPLLADLADGLTELSTRGQGLSTLASWFVSIEISLRATLSAAIKALAVGGKLQRGAMRGATLGLYDPGKNFLGAQDLDALSAAMDEINAERMRYLTTGQLPPKASGPVNPKPKAPDAKEDFLAKLRAAQESMRRTPSATHSEFRQVASLSRLATGRADTQSRELTLLERIAIATEETRDNMPAVGLQD